MEAFVSEHTKEIDGWEGLLRCACETLDRVPETMMKSISVTGKLNGRDGEALSIVALSKQLATEYGIEEVVEIEGSRFTARFWRHDPEPGRNGVSL